ncbi:hypothetical protein AB0K40_43670 [Nonomuraea bangladeshensis]|uniref:Uncharacterized protein n=1 Tax=Nonomuraea bangladeshensis TaxID=404385 RepID=A0ABV3HIS9_9ACTN
MSMPPLGTHVWFGDDDSTFSMDLRVTVAGRTPADLRARALDEARLFYGGRAEHAGVTVLSADVEKADDGYRATVVFRQVTG